MVSQGVFRCAEVSFATFLYIVAWSDVSIIVGHLDWTQHGVISFTLVAGHCGACISLANVVALRFGWLEPTSGLQSLIEARSNRLTLATLLPMLSFIAWIALVTPDYLAQTPNIYFAFGYLSGNVLIWLCLFVSSCANHAFGTRMGL